MTEPSLTRIWRLFWLAVIVGHVLAAIGWWWLQAGGFGWNHPRFWVNRVVPLAVLGWAFGSLAALHAEDRMRLLGWLMAWPAAWFGAAIIGRFIFPVTLAQLWFAPLTLATIMAATLVVGGGGPVERIRRRWFGVAIFWAVIGSVVVWLQRPPAPATRPLQADLAPIGSAGSLGVETGTVKLGPDVMLYPTDASLIVRLSPLTLTIHPLLTFISRSADGCWTVFARPEERAGPEPVFRGILQNDDRARVLSYEFKGQGAATLRAEGGPEPRTLAVEGVSRLDRPVFSHLNSFCDFEISGHHRLELAFSPCPQTRIEVLPFDYPVGRPARFAYVDEERAFRVVEAFSGEKGPFHALAVGRLELPETLEITLFDEGRSIGRIALSDWAFQAGTALSPTAGWGVPVNAIEFSLSGDSPSSPASIFITLSGTSVGRGWDCVAHAAGTYRNRIKIEPVHQVAP